MEMNPSEILDSLINAPCAKSSQYFGCFSGCSGYATPSPRCAQWPTLDDGKVKHPKGKLPFPLNPRDTLMTNDGVSPRERIWPRRTQTLAGLPFYNTCAGARFGNCVNREAISATCPH